MVVFYQQPNYERFQVASDECTISRETDSLYRRKRREQSMLHGKRLRWNSGFLRGYRCEEGAQAAHRASRWSSDRRLKAIRRGNVSPVENSAGVQPASGRAGRT